MSPLKKLNGIVKGSCLATSFLTLLPLMLCLAADNAFAQSSATASQESWQSISNHWGTVPLSKIIQAAEANDLSAQYFLGAAFADGNVVSKDPRESFKWMSKAAQQGMARAQREAAFMHYDGTGTEQNFIEAARLCRLAAEQGDAHAQNLLGWLYQKGQGIQENPQEAVKWYERAAARSNSMAQINLAWIYAAGIYGATNTFGQGSEAQVKSGGIAPNHDLAESWMKKAVDLNSSEGQYKFAKLLYGEFNDQGFHDETRFTEAAKWFQKAAEKGNIQAEYELASMLHTGKLGDDQRSNCIPWFLKAAAQGNAQAQAQVGRLRQYYPDSELLKDVDAIGVLKQSAEQGDLSAQFELAQRYHFGNGVTKDPNEAFNWMKKAAKHEITPITLTIDAHYYLGVMYETGEGTTKDLTNAFRLYLEAAVGGNKPEPFTRVGQMYEKGEGVPQDYSLAATNYFIATQFGFFPTSDDSARCAAIENLFSLYLHERGLPENKAQVAKQLDTLKQTPVTTAKAQLLLGETYFQGKVVAKDLVEATAWLRLAAAQNYEDSQAQLKSAEALLTPDEKQAASRRFEQLAAANKQAQVSYQQFENFRRGKGW